MLPGRPPLDDPHGDHRSISKGTQAAGTSVVRLRVEQIGGVFSEHLLVGEGLQEGPSYPSRRPLIQVEEVVARQLLDGVDLK